MIPPSNPVEAVVQAVRERTQEPIPMHDYSPHYRGCASICGEIVAGAMCCRPRSHSSHNAPTAPVVPGPDGQATKKPAPAPVEEWFDYTTIPVPRFQ